MKMDIAPSVAKGWLIKYDYDSSFYCSDDFQRNYPDH